MSVSDFQEGPNVKVSDLNPNSKQVNILLKVVSKSEVREVTSRRDMTVNRISDILVGDETGCILMSVWNETIDDIEEGNVLQVKNGFVKLFRGNMRLNIGRYGSYTKVDGGVETVNTENNVSNKQYEEERPYRPYRSYDRGSFGGYGGDRGYRRGGYRR